MRLRGSTRSRSLPSSQTEYSLWGRGRGARCGGHLHAILEPDRDFAVHVEGNQWQSQGQSMAITWAINGNHEGSQGSVVERITGDQEQ